MSSEVITCRRVFSTLKMSFSVPLRKSESLLNRNFLEVFLSVKVTCFLTFGLDSFGVMLS